MPQINPQSTNNYDNQGLTSNWLINKLAGDIDTPNMESDMRGIRNLLRSLSRVGIINPEQQDRAQHFYGSKSFQDDYGTKDAFSAGLGHEIEGLVMHGHSPMSAIVDMMNNVMGLKDDSDYNAKDFFNLISKHSEALEEAGHLSQLAEVSGTNLPPDLTKIPTEDIEKILDYIKYSDANTWMPPEFKTVKDSLIKGAGTHKQHYYK